MELLPNSLKSPPTGFVHLPGSEKSSNFVNWMIDITDALTKFHGISTIHPDTKPENILIKEDTILIADFGLATQDPNVSSILHPFTVLKSIWLLSKAKGCRMEEAPMYLRWVVSSLSLLFSE
jgi:serine/threonine protein kinase